MNSYYDIWNQYIYFFSASSTQEYLKKCYRKAKITDGDIKSFENSYTFQYYLEHAKTFYTQAISSPLSIQPILVFYGFIQLLKACLLTLDPNYPESTAVLAHGVTTRKRKKQQYEFFTDEVKVQKNGLFTHMAEKMFNIKHLEGEKFSMGQLLQQIPELNDAFLFLMSQKTFEKMEGKESNYKINLDILNKYHMTKDRLGDFLQSKTALSLNLQEKEFLEIDTSVPITYNNHSPFHYCLGNKQFVISLIKDSTCYVFPELLTHYLILYNLGMISRYETEWWSELLKTTPNDDYPYICHFMQATLIKGPFLIYQWLTKERFL
ncbi:YaaC family protein [Peribacillus sp. SCS-155]|uniref:YaaC family protein n=1 Tax=Peribacillus sedimenti TaxID=3115297 RepID=UPI0039061611